MRNVTGRESRQYSYTELTEMAEDSVERNAPEWVTRELIKQSLLQFIPLVRE